jgi:penicillin-binding protein 1A
MGTLASSVQWGAKFTYKDEKGKSYRMPAAGKTGTTQNWSDAWAVGFTPYYTTAIWFGFDKPGNSLGLSLTGATLSGPVWANVMRDIHQGLPLRDFVRPASGIIDVTVCAKSGLLMTQACNEGEVTLPFLAGTQPVEYCNIHGSASYSSQTALGTMRSDTLGLDEEMLLGSLSMPTLRFDLLPEPPRDSGGTNPPGGTTVNRNTPGRGSSRVLTPSRPTPNRRFSGTAPNNPLLDGDLPAAGSSPGEEAANSGETENDPEDDYGLELPDYDPLLD